MLVYTHLEVLFMVIIVMFNVRIYKKKYQKEELNKMLNEDDYCEDYLKLSKRKIYKAFIFFRDKIDYNQKLREQLFNIVFYLTKNKYWKL